MRREYDFIQNLDARDVNYVAEKKLEHAALLVQRNWRRLKAEREYRKHRRGESVERDDFEKTEEDLERIRVNKETHAKTLAYYRQKYPDTFYDQISEEQLAALKE